MSVSCRAVRCLAVAIALMPLAAVALPLCDSVEQRVAFFRGMDPWRKALTDKKFEELDRQFNGLIAAYESGKMTDHELHRWFELFYAWNPGREPLHDDWVRAYPNSAAAHLGSAYHYMARGFNARGTEFSDKTSDSQLQAMGGEFRNSFYALDKADARMKKSTLGVAMRIRMLAASGDPGGRIRRELYETALKKYPDTLQVRVQWIAMSHPKWGGSVKQLKDAESEAKPLGQDDRRYIEYLVTEELGSVYYWSKDYPRAAEYYEKAIPLCPGLDGAANDLIHLYKDTKNFDALIPLLDRYVEKNPRSGWAYAMRGWANLEKKLWTQSFKDYEKSASLGHSDGFEGLAWHYERGIAVKPDYARAIDLYELAATNGSSTAGQKADNVRKGAGIKMR